MASLLKLKTDIKKLKAAIASKATSGAIKTKLRGKLTTLENELDKLQPNKRKPKTTGPKSESALVRLAKKRRTNQGLSTSKSDIERDAIRPAKKAGKRTSANGNRYYEYRDNRVDNRQPPKKYRKLADGGHMADKGTYVTSGFTTFDESNNLIVDKFKMQDWYEDFNDEFEKLVTKKYITQAEYEKYQEILERVDPIDKYGEMSGRAAVKKFVDDNKRYTKMADGGETSSKNFNTKYNVGRAKYVINYHDGKKTHKDGSPFYDIATFKNMKDFMAYKKKLNSEGYKEYKDGGYMADGGRTQGYDDKKDESLGMTRGKLSLKDFVGNRKQKEHARRDDARFEERGKMADGGAVSTRELNKKIKSWYMKTYPTDDMGKDIRDEITFKSLWNMMHQGYDVYDILDVYDSIVRERVFEKLSKILGVDYDVVYNKWLGYADGGMMAKGGKTKDQEVVRGYFEDEAYEYADGGKIWTIGEYQTIEDWNSATKKDGTKTSISAEGYPIRKNGVNVYVVKSKKEAIEKVKRLNSKLEQGGYMEHGGSVAKGNYEMLLSQAKEVMHHAEELMQVAKPDMDIEAWVVAKAERATTDLSDITHYLDGLKMAMGGMVKHNAHKVNA